LYSLYSSDFGNKSFPTSRVKKAEQPSKTIWECYH
jgi:hypothetical protein